MSVWGVKVRVYGLVYAFRVKGLCVCVCVCVSEVRVRVWLSRALRRNFNFSVSY